MKTTKTEMKTEIVDGRNETNTSSRSSLNLYLGEINRIPLLNRAEEERYARMAAQGNKAARERLVNANLRFVISVAKKYQGKGLPLEDLISEGNVGLVTAMDHFDVEKGYRFITYAVWWIRQSIIRAIHEKGRMIRLPCNKANELNQINSTRQSIQNEQSWNSETEIQEIATFLEMSPEKAADLMQIGLDALSLDDLALKQENSLTVKDFIVDEISMSPSEEAINSILKEELAEAVNGLEKRSAEVLRCRFGLGDSGPMTLKEIGNMYNLSRERIRQIERQALGQLQKSPT
ncbi:MAG: RNA polymerase sigma factor RpoD/SigA, partial [Treponema sp.]|nr:RNA polymerase sigma factor RpoD/SigA [Treponema sp.]